MWFWASIVIAVASGLTDPFLTRLHATGLWAGKAITPAQLADQLPTGLQDALTHGWISRTVFLGKLFQLSAILVGFMAAWWMAPGAYLIILSTVVVAERLPIPSPLLEPYLEILHAHATRRAKAFKVEGDNAREFLATDLTKDVQDLLNLYVGSGVLVPSVREALSAPIGNRSYLLPERPS